MENKKEMTIPNVSAATDAEQSLSKCTDNSIVNQDTDFKGYEQSFEEMQREILRQLDPSYLKTVSMTTLYDTVFEVQTPLIDGLLQRGTYLFVGSPKVGKSFMMAQLAYHISTGTPLWEYKVRKATVLYFALEDDYPRLQKRLFQMFGAKETGNLYFATECKTVNGGLEEQIRGFMREHPDTGLIIIDTLKRVREAGGADYSNEKDVANTYLLSNGEVTATLYYQPVISAVQFENDLTLFRTTKPPAGNPDYYTPDFVLKFASSEDDEEYAIFDAKFSSRANIKKHSLPEVIRKYSCEISAASRSSAPKMVWVLQGRVNGSENAIWKYHNSQLASTYRPITSFGIVSINTAVEIRQRLWNEIRSSISLLQ